ncbi:hypothetical protein [Actinocorallia longicatena]
MSTARHGASYAARGTGRARHMAADGTVAARRMAAERTMAARGWTGPQMERVACLFDDMIAPRISNAMHGTAGWIEPPRPVSHRRRNFVMGFVAAFAVIGVAAVATQYRRGQLADMLEPEDGLEYELRYREESGEGRESGNLSGTFSSASGGASGVGRGGGTGSSRGIGND